MSVTRNASQRRLIVATITAIYVLSVVQLGFQWWGLNWEFITNGDSRDTVFFALVVTPTWFSALGFLCTLLVLILADGLLVSRI